MRTPFGSVAVSVAGVVAGGTFAGGVGTPGMGVSMDGCEDTPGAMDGTSSDADDANPTATGARFRLAVMAHKGPTRDPKARASGDDA